MTIKQAAALRGVTIAAIMNLVQRGKLTPIKVGEVTLLHCAEVKTYEPKKTGRPRRKPQS